MIGLVISTNIGLLKNDFVNELTKLHSFASFDCAKASEACKCVQFYPKKNFKIFA
jgi:hypothetical protein